MGMPRTVLREFAVIGARQRLVALEHERQKIFLEFPELEASYVAAGGAPVKAGKGKNGHAKKKKDGRATRNTPLSKTQLKALEFLKGKGEVRTQALAKGIGIKATAASSLVARLRKRGAVKFRVGPVAGEKGTTGFVELLP